LVGEGQIHRRLEAGLVVIDGFVEIEVPVVPHLQLDVCAKAQGIGEAVRRVGWVVEIERHATLCPGIVTCRHQQANLRNREKRRSHR
jgi:hypothetical protein